MLVKILLWSDESKSYDSGWTLDLISIPFIGSKINYAPVKGGISYIYKVIDVRYGDNQIADVAVELICTQDEYNLRKP